LEEKDKPTKVDDKASSREGDNNIDQKMNVTAMTVGSHKFLGTETRLYENITLATYTCDFGNVVINSVKKRPIKI